MYKTPPFKGVSIRIPIIIPIRGGGLLITGLDYGIACNIDLILPLVPLLDAMANVVISAVARFEPIFVVHVFCSANDSHATSNMPISSFLRRTPHPVIVMYQEYKGTRI